jgi:signal transduction histidine kinase
MHVENHRRITPVQKHRVDKPGGFARCLVHLVIFLTCFGAYAQQSSPRINPLVPVLTTAREVARFGDPNPLSQPAVKIEAVITFLDSNGTTFIRDATGSTFFRRQGKGNFQPGQTVAIEGIRTPGLYIGGVQASKVDVIAAGPPPEPRKTTLSELSTGKHHYEFVEVEGVGRSVELTGETTAILRMNVDGGILEVQFDQAPENPGSLVDAAILIRGLAAGAINDHRQLVYPYLRAADGNAVTVIDPAPSDPFVIADTPLSSLSDFARPGIVSHRIKISGIALGPVMNGSVFIRSGDRGVRVTTSRPLPLEAGDSVEALGFPQMGKFSATLADTVLRKKPGPKEPVQAVKPDNKRITSGALDAELVSMEATVVQVLEDENLILARRENQTLRILTGGWKLPAIAPNTRASFTGIWLVTEAKHSGYRATPTEHELWLRDQSDITIISKPSWWNTRKLSIALGMVAGFGVLALIWAALLQRQIARQLKVIETKAQREAMIEERQRIAREFHDTLEQELAGLSLRLDAAAPRVSDEKARTLLNQLRHLLLRLQTETRDFVWDLRDESQHSSPLETSLEKLVGHLQTTTSIPIRFICDDDLPPVTALAQHHLLRISREAVNNAIKYSAAKTIRISLDRLPGSVRLRIEDDGAGFNLAERSGASGHFGIQGMKERVRKLGAELDLRSSPGEGTRVEVVLAIGGAHQ